MITIVVGSEEVTVDFFSSDSHIGHRNIARLAGRPFDNDESTSHMDETIIQRWNELVQPDDTVLVLGDLALGSLSESLDKCARLNGIKLLVPGNHDRVSSLESPARIERFTPLYENAGYIILPEIVDLEIAGKPALASHYPYVGDSREVSRYGHLRPEDNGLPLIHGHTHQSTALGDHPRQFHVGVDAHNFAPVPSRVIEEWAERL